MKKPFAQCSLSDLTFEIILAARAATCSALDAAAAATLLPRLTNAEATEKRLQRHPLVRDAGGLVCTSTAESEQAWCSMLRDLFSASGTAVSNAALLRVYLVCSECCRRGCVRVCAFISRVLSHPAAPFAGHELVAQLTAHPVYCLASQINFARWRAMLRCRTPSSAHAPHWYVTGIDIGLQQRQAVLCRGGLLSVLVPKLLCIQGEYAVMYPLNLAKRIASRRHFLGLKQNEAEGLFEEGQRLYWEQRFSDAVERWGQAALMQHGPSHAHLSQMLIEGRPGVENDHRRSFAFASAGAALGCAHSKGALGDCYVHGLGVHNKKKYRGKEEARGLALARESAAAGSCFGQFVVGTCYKNGTGGIYQDFTEAVRFCRLAAVQDFSAAQTELGWLLENGFGVEQDRAEAIRWYRLAAAQGYSDAQNHLRRLGL
jgi:hypothetical protein